MFGCLLGGDAIFIRQMLAIAFVHNLSVNLNIFKSCKIVLVRFALAMLIQFYRSFAETFGHEIFEISIFLFLNFQGLSTEKNIEISTENNSVSRTSKFEMKPILFYRHSRSLVKQYS